MDIKIPVDDRDKVAKEIEDILISAKRKYENQE